MLRGIDFYRPAHEAIYESIIDLYGRGEPADAVTVSDLLTKRGEIARIGGPAYLHTLLQSVPTAANAGFYAEIVRERAVLRRLVEAGTKIVQMGYSQDGEVDEIVNQAQAEVYAVAERRTAEDYVPLRDIIEGTVDEIESAGHRGEGMTGVPTGFYELDELTQGLHGGQMIVIAARPAVGKSTLLGFRRSAAIKNNMTAVFFSLEMGRNEIAMRLLSAEASIGLQDLRKGTIKDEQWGKIATTMGRLNDAPLFIDDSPEHVADGDPRQVPPPEAEARPQAGGARLPAADELRQARRIPPAGSLRVLPRPQAPGQGARRPGHRALPAEPWLRTAHRQEADGLRPA